MSLPDRFETYDEYRDWLDDQVEAEIEEFLEHYQAEIKEQGYVDHDALYEWVNESPVLGQPNWDWARLYDDVLEHSDAVSGGTTIHLPRQDPWQEIAILVVTWIRQDMSARMQEMLEERGYEVD